MAKIKNAACSAVKKHFKNNTADNLEILKAFFPPFRLSQKIIPYK